MISHERTEHGVLTANHDSKINIYIIVHSDMVSGCIVYTIVKKNPNMRCKPKFVLPIFHRPAKNYVFSTSVIFECF